MYPYIKLPKFASLDASRLIGPANVFVSHAWSYSFSTPLCVMRQFAKQHPGSFFWFDVLINNQHNLGAAESKPIDMYNWLCTTFKESICSIGRVLLVVSPWHAPVPLTRAWCLFEIMTSLKAGNDAVQFDIMLPLAQRELLKNGLAENFRAILDALETIDAEKATAMKIEDRDAIFASIQMSLGFANFNKIMNEKLRNW